MFFKPLDLTTALRPSLLPDESLLFVQDAVGLYEGKFKIPSYQHGHAYLTSHRVCYVATDEPRKYSVSIDLRDVDRAEHQAGFLKSSAKITIFPKPQKRSLIQQQQSTPPLAPSGQPTQTLASRGASPNPPQSINATWVCPICSFSNPVPSNFEASASPPIPPCLACGIKPPLTTILKATIAAATSRESPGLKSTTDVQSSQEGQVELGTAELHNLAPRARPVPSPCPRCTFLNHPSLRECEICGASLSPSGSNNGATIAGNRAESPAPFVDQTSITNREISDSIKLSFREGGDKTFYERLKSCLVQRKWLLQNAPPIPQLSQSPHRGDAYEASPNRSGQSTPRPSAVGIAGLEQRGLESRKNTELVIGNAFEDLEALMASAKQVVSLAETLASESGISGSGGSAEANAVLSESAAALNMVTTKDMLGSGAENLYLSELSRNLAEYLTDDRTGVLRKEGGIMSLIDLWALFNRTRNGVELVSPADFEQAAQLWEKLRLPVRLRRFKSGLLVVQPSNWNDEKTIQQLDEWLQELRQQPPTENANWNWTMYGRGITAQETAQHFGWSVGVAAEELEMAEDRGVLCREESIEGVRFWRNYFLLGDSHVGLEQRILQLGL